RSPGRRGPFRLTMRAAATLSAALALVPAPALGQAYQCRAPVTVAVPAAPRDGPVRRVPITGYTLALSWSPEYCHGRETRVAARRPGAARDGRLGSVVHGSRPEGRGAAWPRRCASQRAPTGRQPARILCTTPSAALLAHEWAKHGACMSPTPESYFGT